MKKDIAFIGKKLENLVGRRTSRVKTFINKVTDKVKRK
jgi:hypothetical protein